MQREIINIKTQLNEREGQLSMTMKGRMGDDQFGDLSFKGSPMNLGGIGSGRLQKVDMMFDSKGENGFGGEVQE